MTDRANNNSTSYEHPEESNLLNLHKVMEYNGDGKPILRVSVGGESITISGDVTIPGSVEINNDEGNPIPAHVHLFGDDGVEYSDSNPFMTKLDATTLAALESVDLNPATLAALETTNVGTVAGNVQVEGEVELGSTSLAELENISIDAGDITVSGEMALDSATLAALENVTVDEVVATVKTDPQDHLYDLAAGTISGKESVTQAGRNDTISLEMETVWDGTGIYSYLTSASQVYVTSTADQDTEDSPIGKGARSVQITGLNSSYNEVTEEVDIDDGNSTTLFLRIHEVKVKTVGESGQALGEISVRTQPMRGGTLLAQVATIGEGFGSSLGKSFMAVYTVPAGKTAYLEQLNGGSSRGSDTSFYVVSKTFGEDVFISQDIAISSGAGFGKEYKVPLQFTEKTDIEIRAVSNNEDSIGNECSAGFNLVLVDNA